MFNYKECDNEITLFLLQSDLLWKLKRKKSF